MGAAGPGPRLPGRFLAQIETTVHCPLAEVKASGQGRPAFLPLLIKSAYRLDHAQDAP